MEGDVKAAVTRLARPASRVSKRKRARPIARVGRDEIAGRAYEIYLARGAGAGHDLDDWLQAERELCFPPPQG